MAYTYDKAGFGGRLEPGRRPALLIIDLNYAFTDESSPLHCATDSTIAAVQALLAAARKCGAPVAYSTVEYDEAGSRIARAMLAKCPNLSIMAPGSRWSQIDERIAAQPGETVLRKIFPSAFFGTALASLLAAEGCDSVVVAGASTSGCVRATAVDAVQYGYSVVIARDAVADRAPEYHEGSLRDLDAKYADVLDLSEAVGRLSQRADVLARGGAA